MNNFQKLKRKSKNGQFKKIEASNDQHISQDQNFLTQILKNQNRQNDHTNFQSVCKNTTFHLVFEIKWENGGKIVFELGVSQTSPNKLHCAHKKLLHVSH